jgi:hypothetical protein
MGPGMLVAYDETGSIIATRNWHVIFDEQGRPIGLLDFAAHEAAGREMTEVWRVSAQTTDNATATTTPLPVKGSKVWPEWLGGRIHEFTVELDGPPGQKYIAALVHKESGYRRERDAIEAAITERIEATPQGEPVDLRDIVGGPDRPISLDDAGATAPVEVVSAPSTLPLIGVTPPLGSSG